MIVSGLGAQSSYGSYGQAVLANTWGHLAPKKNTTYRGKAIIMKSTHGEYGSGSLVLDYDLGEISGPYTHSDLIGILGSIELPETDEICLYEVSVTFRNYVYYIGKPRKIFDYEKTQKT